MKTLEEKGYSKEQIQNMFPARAQECYYCNEQSSYEVGRNHKTRFSMMLCDTCDKSYMVDWKKQEEVKKYNIILPKE